MASTVGLSTAGAVTVLNEKGELSMQKVKVQRYVSGRRPKYATKSSSESEESEEEFLSERKRKVEENEEKQEASVISAPVVVHIHEDVIRSDRRLQRLQRRDDDSRQRHITEPQLLAVGQDDGEKRRPRREVESEDSDRDEAEEENVERRHALLRERRFLNEEELLEHEEEGESEEAEDEESEYEEYTDSEDDTGPRLKPVFVRKKDRLTVKEREKEDIKLKEAEMEAKYLAEERRKQALKMIEDDHKRELQEKEEEESEEQLLASIAAINTDDENEEAAYETWKLRELKRVKRDKDERDQLIKEKLEIERIRNMTEEERQAEFKNNPKVVTNKAPKGKYKFLQKYYHRGVFFLDEDDEVFKRDFAQPTLEDHFDKTVLPKVMQVKNFGRSGRTKYTHLVDQDTTAFDSPWVAESAQTSKFHSTQAGGLKQVFDRPTKKRK